MAFWPGKPAGQNIVQFDQGSQFTNWEWQTFLRQHNLEPSMSQRGSCHDTAIAESFFQLLKRKRGGWSHFRYKLLFTGFFWLRR